MPTKLLLCWAWCPQPLPVQLWQPQGRHWRQLQHRPAHMKPCTTARCAHSCGSSRCLGCAADCGSVRQARLTKQTSTLRVVIMPFRLLLGTVEYLVQLRWCRTETHHLSCLPESWSVNCLQDCPCHCVCDTLLQNMLGFANVTDTKRMVMHSCQVATVQHPAACDALTRVLLSSPKLFPLPSAHRNQGAATPPSPRPNNCCNLYFSHPPTPPPPLPTIDMALIACR